MKKSQILALADRAQRMSGKAHAAGDFLACRRLMETAMRYRRIAAEVPSC